MSSPEWQHKKNYFEKFLTVYGRKPVIEALKDNSLTVETLHLAESNKPSSIISDMLYLAEKRGIAVQYHDKLALSRISRNGKQDQGVAADVLMNGFKSLDDFIDDAQENTVLIALDGINNPQNLGMIIRSVTASGCNGLLLSSKENTQLSPLVVKASVGSIFSAPIIKAPALYPALVKLQENGYKIASLTGDTADSLFNYQRGKKTVFVLGNETEGVSKAVLELSDKRLKIPMQNGIESLNVAVAAALVAFYL